MRQLVVAADNLGLFCVRIDAFGIRGRNKPQLAIKAYQRVPEDSSLRRNAEIQLAVDLDALDRTEEAKSHLDKLVAARPNDLEAVVARVPGSDAEQFLTAANAAKAGCPISRLLKTTITMAAQLES